MRQKRVRTPKTKEKGTCGCVDNLMWGRATRSLNIAPADHASATCPLVIESTTDSGTVGVLHLKMVCSGSRRQYLTPV